MFQMVVSAVFLVLFLICLCFLLLGNLSLLVQNCHPILFLFYLAILITIMLIIDIIVSIDFNRTKYYFAFFPKTVFYSVKNGPFGKLLERFIIIYFIVVLFHFYIFFSYKDYLYITNFLLFRGFFFFLFFFCFPFFIRNRILERNDIRI